MQETTQKPPNRRAPQNLKEEQCPARDGSDIAPCRLNGPQVRVRPAPYLVAWSAAAQTSATLAVRALLENSRRRIARRWMRDALWCSSLRTLPSPYQRSSGDFVSHNVSEQGRQLARLSEACIELQVVLSHMMGREAVLEFGPNPRPVEGA